MEALAENRRARFDYEILDTLEAGLELLGLEVKSAANGGADLAGSYAVLRGGGAWLLNARIRPYQAKNTPEGYDEGRSRRLLLKAQEIWDLEAKMKSAKLTLVPLKLYKKGPRVKLLLGLGKGREKADKREHLKRKEAEREIRRRLS